MNESKWLKVKEITIELGTYISRKTYITAEEIEKMVEFSDYLVALTVAHQKIFDKLVEDGYVNCIPIEGIDGYMARFSKKPEDFYEIMCELKGEEQNDETGV